MGVSIDRRSGTVELTDEEIAALVSATLDHEGADPDLEVSIAFVDKAEISELNSTYRGKPGPTDVLSFELDDPWVDRPDGRGVLIGDVIISPEVALEQMEEYGTTPQEEFALLIVHGVLHLLGHDHIEDAEAEEMESRERGILESAGYDLP